MATEGFTNNEGSKVDLYTIIKRRKRTVADFLKENNVRTLKEYQSLSKELEKEYILSSDFIFFALDFLAKPEVLVPEPEATNVVLKIEEKQELGSEPEDEKKSKRRNRKET